MLSNGLPTSRVLVTSVLWLVVLWLVVWPVYADDVVPPSREALEFFESRVKPILQQHCFECHGPGATVKGGLRLTSRDGLLKGGDTGPAVSPEVPVESLLLRAVNYETYEMPPSGKLPQPLIDVLTEWIKMGAPWTPGESVAGSEEDRAESPQVNAATRSHWSFQPVERPELPAVQRSDWVRTPIDRFILAKLEAAGLEPAPPVDKPALLRRATYDLIGMPPRPDELAAFLADDSPGAFERVINRLLDSPHYGEHWARHWLDLVRYAESNSYERDGTKPFVWRYRDYVIRSFNDDKPYDQFMLEQIAGDELPHVTADSIIATGYYRLGIWQDEPVDPEQELFEDLDDIVRTTAEVFLGITVGCARCHDHKLDPIPQRDYYRFLSFFRNVRRFGVRSHDTVLDASVRSIASQEAQQKHAELVAAHVKRVAQNRDQLIPIESRLKRDLVGVEKDEWKTEAARVEIARQRIGGLITPHDFDRFVTLSRRRDELRTDKPPGLDQALCVKEHGRDCPPTHVLLRGNAHTRAAEVVPGFLTVLGDPDPAVVAPPPSANSTGRRLALAKWLAAKDNPLTPRVMANRVWQYHFGRGVVRSSSDFGLQGMRPTHPGLLEWLAAETTAGGWRLKRLHRMIMLSSSYQMSSRPNTAGLAKDPTNDLFWRFDMRRLSAEEIRDSILAVNGSLNLDRMFGPSIYPAIPAEVLAGQSRPGADWGQSSPTDRARRSVYIHIKRSLVVPMMASFDGADTDASCPVRFSTTQPTQALGMLNGQFVNDQGRVFAEYLRSHAGDDATAQVESALRRTLQREPQADEVTRGLELLRVVRQRFDLAPQDALAQFCVTIMNLNEFLYLD